MKIIFTLIILLVATELLAQTTISNTTALPAGAQSTNIGLQTPGSDGIKFKVFPTNTTVTLTSVAGKVYENIILDHPSDYGVIYRTANGGMSQIKFVDLSRATLEGLGLSSDLIDSAKERQERQQAAWDARAETAAIESAKEAAQRKADQEVQAKVQAQVQAQDQTKANAEAALKAAKDRYDAAIKARNAHPNSVAAKLEAEDACRAYKAAGGTVAY